MLEVKSALAEAVVDGGALSPAATRDVLAELEGMVDRISANLADSGTPLTDEEWVAALLREVETESRAVERPIPGPAASLSREAILALARVLARPAANVYQAVSNSDPDKCYTLTFEASEVTCTCPGFEYRGTCSHSRKLKEALVKGAGLPKGFTEAQEA